MRMLLYGLSKIKFNKNTIIFKLSGRYLIKNLKCVIRQLDKIFSENFDFCIPVSEMFSKTSTILYAFNKRFPEEIFEEICKKVSDGD